MSRLALILFAIAALVGCSWFGGAARAARAAAETVATAPASAPAVTRLPPPADTRTADDQIAHWKAEADSARQARDADARRADDADREVVRLGKVRDALVLDAWRARLAWAAGVALLGVLAGVVLEFVLPAGLRGWATTAILASTALAIAAWTLRAVLPWLVPAAEVGAWAIAAAVVGFALWRLRQAIIAARHAADHGDRMEAAVLGLRDWFTGDESLLHDLVASVKSESAKAQAVAGVGTVLARIRGADPAQSAHVAALPTIRARVAELPPPRPVEPLPHDLPATGASALTPDAIADLAAVIAANTPPPPVAAPGAAP